MKEFNNLNKANKYFSFFNIKNCLFTNDRLLNVVI